jgi:hypothetical protein
MNKLHKRINRIINEFSTDKSGGNGKKYWFEAFGGKYFFDTFWAAWEALKRLRGDDADHNDIKEE